MSEGTMSNQDERVLAALAHGSILIGVLTSGIGGIGVALLIRLTQRGKSSYAAFQALQALVYQVVTTVINVAIWTCWGLAWMAMLLPPLLSNPSAYEYAPPSGLWIGLLLMIVPAGVGVLTVLYGLWGAVRCWGGHDFRYAIIGRWLESHR
jgi:uncharacterized Tic20 family protein